MTEATMYDKIKKARDEARKARDQFAVTTFSTLIGDIEAKNRNQHPGFEDLASATQKIIKSTIEACREMYNHKKEEKSLKEIELLEQFIELGMSEEKILEILNAEQFTELKAVMQHFKKLNVQVDMKQVRELFLGLSN